jgi:MerR family regulatory protein.
MEARDYANRTYLSAIEAAKFLGVSVRMVHRLTAEGLSLASPPTRNRRIYRIETHWLFGGKPAIALNLRLLQVEFHPFVELPKGPPFVAK